MPDSPDEQSGVPRKSAPIKKTPAEARAAIDAVLRQTRINLERVNYEFGPDWYVENGVDGKHFPHLKGEDLRKHARDGLVKADSRLYFDDGKRARFTLASATTDIFDPDASGPIDTSDWTECPTGEAAARISAARARERAREWEQLDPAERRKRLEAVLPGRPKYSEKLEQQKKEEAESDGAFTVIVLIVMVAVTAGGIYVCSGLINKSPDNRNPYERDREDVLRDDPRQWGTPY
ncbi:hypothetical protein [Alienimonas sp. DA493]|uniref:hypothetical protein n=1 Tax=Alienimonas sp. DA493 TaxID=3373605 RepID=UPI003753F9E9